MPKAQQGNHLKGAPSMSSGPGPRDTKVYACPVRDVLDRVGDAWTVLVVLVLVQAGKLRFNQLRREIPAISQRMLTVTLRSLERDGLVSRVVIPSTPPQVEYALTEMGRSLAGAIDVLAGWAEANQPQVQAARRVYDSRKDDSQRDAA